jgi:hypothetical protein
VTTLINTDNVGNTYFGYVTPVTGGVLTDRATFWTSLLGAHLGSEGIKWSRYGSLEISIRFPVAWETITGNVVNRTNFRFNLDFVYNDWTRVCTTTTGYDVLKVAEGFRTYPFLDNSYIFGVINDYSLVYASFTNIYRTTGLAATYAGWLKDPQFTGNQFPRNACILPLGAWDSSIEFYRVKFENLTERTQMSKDSTLMSPAINCSIPTAGANTTDVIWRDSTSPNPYIGKLWNVIQGPSNCVAGQIYKNTGVDPDGSNNAFWMCIGVWGARSLLMRVWTEDIL